METRFSSVEGNSGIQSDIGIILPTYCEAANIGQLIDEIEGLKQKICILVIDDSSPDGTANIVRSLQKKYSNILLSVRSKKSGLGTAITYGFKAFLSLKKPPKYIITMDADYSHNPKEIPQLIESIQQDYDLVIGSRYCRGGGARNWGVIRLIISRIANLIASFRIAARIHDHTSGYRCYSFKLVRNIIDDLHSQTYEIQIETIRQASLQKFRIKEVPITFANRKKGKSKLTFNEIKDFLTYIFGLKRKY
ncbi:polyprenol monophosphomannose synthase [Candidatus Bathyarchaeota archaeon]|nr:polyprenol monophosphomannose synthase [Candidatus Bathyarchaeota archaeon]